MKLSELKDAHKEAVVVVGGSPSAEADVSEVLTRNGGFVVVSANQHAYLLGFIPVDYFVFLGKPDKVTINFDHRKTLLPYAQEPRGATRVSPHEKWSDVEFDVRPWHRGFTGHLAVWFACWITSGPVYICGMDCYVGEKPYFHDQGNEMMPRFPKENHLREWNRGIKEFRNPERVEVISGPLKELEWKNINE